MTPPPLAIIKASDPDKASGIAVETKADGAVVSVVDTVVSGGSDVGLTVSSQLPLEAMAMGTGAVYTCQRVVSSGLSHRATRPEEFHGHAEYLASLLENMPQ